MGKFQSDFRADIRLFGTVVTLDMSTQQTSGEQCAEHCISIISQGLEVSVLLPDFTQRQLGEINTEISNFYI